VGTARKFAHLVRGHAYCESRRGRRPARTTASRPKRGRLRGFETPAPEGSGGAASDAVDCCAAACRDRAGVMPSVRMDGVTSTRVRRLINAPRERVYNALLDPTAVSRWKVPSGMTSRVHEF